MFRTYFYFFTPFIRAYFTDVLCSGKVFFWHIFPNIEEFESFFNNRIALTSLGNGAPEVGSKGWNRQVGVIGEPWYGGIHPAWPLEARNSLGRSLLNGTYTVHLLFVSQFCSNVACR